MYLGRLAIPTLVARDTVQRVYIHKQHIAIAIDELEGLMYLAVLVDFNQSSETSHTVVDVYDIVARFQLVQFRHRHLLIATNLSVDAITLVAVKELMIGVTLHLHGMVDKALM